MRPSFVQASLLSHHRSTFVRCAWLLCLGSILAVSFRTNAFVSNVDSSGARRHWELLTPSVSASTNVFNPETKAIRYNLAAAAYSTTNAAAELNAIRAAFDQWQSVPGTQLKFEEGGLAPSGADVNTSDQTNLIFWAKDSTFVNGGRDNIFGTLAVTYPRVVGNNILVETDIVLNGVQFAWFTDFKNTGSTNQFVESVVLHEIGHFLGFEHSPVGGATMFARGAFGINTQAGLSIDDMAAVRTVYPAAGASAGWGFLRGRVALGTAGVYGACVMAEDLAGNIASGTITDASGNFELTSLLPGSYQVRAAPLDPPSNNSLNRLISGSDIAPAFASAETSFLPTMNQSVLLSSGLTNVLNIFLTPGNPAFRITRIRPPARPADRFVAINSPATMTPGQSNFVVGVYSPNLPTAGATLKITGDGLVLGAASFVLDAFPGSNPSLNLISIPISVATNATPGLRSFVVQQGTNLAGANGFLEILPRFPDYNFDGLDDNFQREYYPRFTSTTARPGADADEDGLINLAEYLAGTHPLEAASLLRIEQVVLTPSGCLITWQSVTGKRYQVVSRSPINVGTWVPLGSEVLATGEHTSFFDISATNLVRFYRVQVLP